MYTNIFLKTFLTKNPVLAALFYPRATLKLNAKDPTEPSYFYTFLKIFSRDASVLIV